MTDEDQSILDTEIIIALSSKPDHFFSQYELYNIISEADNYVNSPNTYNFKQKFVTTFLTIENRYKNVYRFIIDQCQYLVWSTKSRSDVRNNLVKEHLDVRVDFMTDDDYFTLIDDAIENADIDFNPCAFLDTNMTAVHFLVKKGCVNTLKRLLNIYDDININMKTAQGNTVFDIVYGTKDLEMLEFLLRYQHEKECADLKKYIAIQRKVFDKTIDDLRYKMKLIMGMGIGLCCSLLTVVPLYF